MANGVAGSSSWTDTLQAHGLQPDDTDGEQEGRAISGVIDSVTECVTDTTKTLADIRGNSQDSISSMLLGIQNCKLPQGQTQRWIQSLECLFVDYPRKGPRSGSETGYIRRKPINPRLSPRYIALSYTWEPAEGEATITGGYQIESRFGRGFASTELRDVVLDRVSKYAQHHKIKYFWIDRECINQADADEQELAIQSMDMVYQLSKFPIALLSFRIDDEDSLSTLINLLRGWFVLEDPTLTLRFKTVDANKKVLKMLARIVADRWWTRAWTFQENYRAAMRMELLFQHAYKLELLKLQWPEFFGNLEGELCVKSTILHAEASRFCLAYKKEPWIEYQDVEACNLVLQRAGKYTTILEDRSVDTDDRICTPMSPRVFTDLSSRGLEKEFDILAIAANLCNYSVRLDANKLQREGCSLSLAMLALSLMNGEILTYHDHPPTRQSESARLLDNVLEFLQKHSLRSVRSPIAQSLTFAKHCRLVDVRLTTDGIQTNGHIWRLGRKVLLGSGFHEPGPDRSYDIGLSGNERLWMHHLARELDSGALGRQYSPLAADIDRYLHDDCNTTTSNATREFKDCMARDIVEAMRLGRELQLASIVDPQRPNNFGSYSGIFVDSVGKGFEHVFTSWSATDGFEKHVSMGISLQEPIGTRYPRLALRSWVNGLFFFSRTEKQVTCVIPWPNPFIV